MAVLQATLRCALITSPSCEGPEHSCMALVWGLQALAARLQGHRVHSVTATDGAGGVGM